ncbi:MAG TPA: NTP transferase domain-containing protein [Actinomycetota bacterium]|nr:NTP transferase domain-containing protein [Actinomycetota bacterium]
MAKLRAVVLAAGRGVRMGGNEPKTLLPLGDRQPLLYYILRGLKQAGIEDLMVVTGFKPQVVQEYVTEQWGEATFVFNARFASWGNFHTLRLALDQSPGMDVMAVNSDIVVHPNVLKNVRETPGDLVLAVQQRYTLNEEDMRVKIDGNKVLAIGKHLPKRISHGEFAGVSLLRPDGAAAYLEIASDLEWQADTQGYYEDVFGKMLARVDAREAQVGQDEYAEVDLPADVEQAVRVIDRHPDAWGVPAQTTPS